MSLIHLEEKGVLLNMDEIVSIQESTYPLSLHFRFKSGYELDIYGITLQAFIDEYNSK